MDSETGQLYAFDLEDGQPPIMLDSDSWKAMRAYADAKASGPCGKGWEGAKPNCKRVAKGAAKKTAAEVGGIKKLGQGGLSAGNAARLAQLREKVAENRSVNPAQGQSLFPQNRESTRDKGKGAITAANTKRAKDKSAASKRAETKAKNQAVKSETSALGRLGKTPEAAPRLELLRARAKSKSAESERLKSRDQRLAEGKSKVEAARARSLERMRASNAK